MHELCFDLTLVQAQGHGKLGTHALMLALEQLNNIKHE